MAGYLVVTGSYLGNVHLHSILRSCYIQQYMVTVHIYSVYTLGVMLLCIICIYYLLHKVRSQWIQLS